MTPALAERLEALPQQIALHAGTPPMLRVHVVGVVERAAVCTSAAGTPELVVTLAAAPGGGQAVVAHVGPGPRVVDLEDLAHRLPPGAGCVLVGSGLRSVRVDAGQVRRVMLLDCDGVAPVPSEVTP